MERATLLDRLSCSAPPGVNEKVTKFNKRLIDFYDAILHLKVLKVKLEFHPHIPDSIKSAIRQRCNLRMSAFKASRVLNIFFMNFKQLITTFHKNKLIFSKLND